MAPQRAARAGPRRLTHLATPEEQQQELRPGGSQECAQEARPEGPQGDARGPDARRELQGREQHLRRPVV